MGRGLLQVAKDKSGRIGEEPAEGRRIAEATVRVGVGRVVRFQVRGEVSGGLRAVLRRAGDSVETIGGSLPSSAIALDGFREAVEARDSPSDRVHAVGPVGVGDRQLNGSDRGAEDHVGGGRGPPIQDQGGARGSSDDRDRDAEDEGDGGAVPDAVHQGAAEGVGLGRRGDAVERRDAVGGFRGEEEHCRGKDEKRHAGCR